MATISSHAFQQMRFATASDSERLRAGPFPDFLIAGPQRTGSTWLHRVLEDHPQIYLSRPKELYYLAVLDQPNHYQHQTTDLSFYLDHFRKESLITQRRAFCREHFSTEYKPVVYAEATASYAAMAEHLVAEAVLLNPNIKVLITIRNPMDRMWSHAKMQLGRTLTGRRLEEVSDREFQEFGDSSYHQRCGFYSEQIATWSRYLQPGHLFVGIFEHVTTRPVEYACDVLRFLGVDDDSRFVARHIRHNPNPTEVAGDVPERFLPQLNRLYAAEMQLLREQYPVPW